MKKIKHITFALCAFVLAQSLNSCFSLDEYNPGGDTADNVFSTEIGHTGLVNLAYSSLRKEFYGREIPVGLTFVGTDIWHGPPTRSEYFATTLYGNALDPLQGSQITNSWNRFYIPINHANAAIERAPTANYSSNTLRDQRVAEARFLRAFYYWHLVEHWGGVALKMDETRGFVNTAQRSPVDSFYIACILPDLRFAAATLPVTQADHGRVTRAGAQGMLARMYLTYASYLHYHQNRPDEARLYYDSARIAADVVIAGRMDYASAIADGASGTPVLFATPAQIFDQRNNKNNKEAMFVVSHATELGQGLHPRIDQINRLCNYFIPSYASMGMGVEITNIKSRPSRSESQYGYADGVTAAPTRFLLDLYDGRDNRDSRYEAFFREVWRCNDTTAINADWVLSAITTFDKNPNLFRLMDPEYPPNFQLPSGPNVTTKLGFQIGDTAMYFTKNRVPNKADVRYAVRDRDDIYNEDGTFRTNMNFYPELLKHRDTIWSSEATRNSAGRNDVIMMRLAEMYLIAAEAAFHLGDDAAALAYVNVIRRRAAIPAGSTVNDADMTEVNTGMPVYSLQGGHLNFILNERARELAGEHLRWFDLKRTKQLEHRLGVGKANPDVVLFNPEKHYLRPIPQTFLESIENASQFGQNPGY